MTIQSGWYRLWFGIAVLSLAFGIWTATTLPLVSMTRTEATCFPSTQKTSTDYEMVRQPTDDEVTIARMKLQRDLVGSGIKADSASLDFNARNEAEMAIARSATHEECVPLGDGLLRIFFALVAAALLAPLFFVVRWIGRGFASDMS